MARMITGFFDDDGVARNAIRDLEEAGILPSEITLVANNADDRWNLLPRYGDTAAGAAAGAGIGGVVGGGAGLLAGIGMLSIPGLGSVVAAGWLVSTAAGAATGAVAGGIIGLLVGAGIASEHAQVYAEGIRRGGTLIVVRTNDDRAPAARVALSRNGAVDPDQRSTYYHETGWAGFDDNAPPLTASEIDADRVRYTDRMHWLP
ncbi:hypothetical protein SAMN05519103_09514 [Rhizobiales bacterium GAS113]|nr:hypothetical protein SAMN05519103_09514 [Rhizobiales bacterium GAS113]